jgi:multidrug efflux system membrane fusion protein
MKPSVPRPGAAGLAGVALVLAVGCGKHDEPARALTPVKVQRVETSTGGRGMRYSANCRPDVQVDVAFKVGGYVAELLQVQGADGRKRSVQEGDLVSRGAVLARVRDSEYRDRVTEAEAALTQAKADLDRASQLYENQNISKADYDAAYARNTSAQARYDQAVLTLRDATLTAPIDGYVLKRSIEVGTLVTPGAPALVLGDLRSVKVVFGVPDVAVASMKLGDAVSIRTEAFPGEEFKGRITRVSASADPNSRVFDVECTIPNADLRLKSGMVASLQVAQQETRAPAALVPLNAVVRPKADPKGYAVFVVQGQEGKTTAHERVVALGDLVGNAVAVNTGLQAGELVVVTGATLIRDTEEVRVIP